ncbi:hypothetical protein [Streptomyces erythrochromogenes]|uniref:hypothetical protein n=1 Tax=Streptomyces erythrochromogenes TaxID=285574 RepID=UPI0037D3827D
MTTTEMATTEAGEILVRIDPAENWYASLARAAAEAEQRGLGLRLVLTTAPQQDLPPATESRARPVDITRPGSARMGCSQVCGQPRTARATRHT